MSSHLWREATLWSSVWREKQKDLMTLMTALVLKAVQSVHDPGKKSQERLK